MSPHSLENQGNTKTGKGATGELQQLGLHQGKGLCISHLPIYFCQNSWPLPWVHSVAAKDKIILFHLRCFDSWLPPEKTLNNWFLVTAGKNVEQSMRQWRLTNFPTTWKLPFFMKLSLMSFYRNLALRILQAPRTLNWLLATSASHYTSPGALGIAVVKVEESSLKVFIFGTGYFSRFIVDMQPNRDISRLKKSSTLTYVQSVKLKIPLTLVTQRYNHQPHLCPSGNTVNSQIQSMRSSVLADLPHKAKTKKTLSWWGCWPIPYNILDAFSHCRETISWTWYAWENCHFYFESPQRPQANLSNHFYCQALI